MKFVMYQNCVSPHQVPLARELVKMLGEDNFRYVYCDRQRVSRVKLGWSVDAFAPWFVHVESSPGEARELIENAENLLLMFRDVDLIARRCKKGLRTFYDSERWFKPIPVVKSRALNVFAPGWLRLVRPAYWRMAWRMTRLLKSDPNSFYLPIGVHAARDMRLMGVPSSKMIPWGYFVAPSVLGNYPSVNEAPRGQLLKVLCVGRLIELKRFDTVVRAVAMANAGGTQCRLTILGNGPEESRLKSLANRLSVNCEFRAPVPIDHVRSIMREHDVLVFSSNGLEGWGAVVSEALEEGIRVAGTYESGAAATILPQSNLFHAGDEKRLAEILKQGPAKVPVGDWSAAAAARRLCAFLK